MDSPAPKVTLTNADKVLYPATGTDKADVFDYYTSIAEVMVPHIAGRPATRKRWPNGVDQAAFFEKQLASSAPDWLDRGGITHRSGTTTYPVIDSVSGLAWIAQQAALEVHVPQWRFVNSKPGPATRLVFDLDPGDDVTMRQLCDVARAIRDLMDDIGLTTFPVTSGSKGLHLYARFGTPVSSQGASVLGETRCAAAGAGDAHARHRDHDQEPACRPGVRGLESEQRGQDHDRAVFAARAFPPDGCRAAQLGGARRPRSAAAALSTKCWNALRATATCSPNSTTRWRCRTG